LRLTGGAAGTLLILLGALLYFVAAEAGFGATAGKAAAGLRVVGELAAKLWDVDERAGRQRLVTKGIYRLTPDQRGRVRFQLNAAT